MPNEQVTNYLRENRKKFSREALVEQLKASGYPKSDIAEGIAEVYEGKAAARPASASTDFFDFKTPRIYTTQWEKTKDALFGFFVPMLLFFFPFLPLITDIFFLVYFWNRRRFIAYGVIDRWVIGIFAVVLFVRVLSGKFDWFQ